MAQLLLWSTVALLIAGILVRMFAFLSPGWFKRDLLPMFTRFSQQAKHVFGAVLALASLWFFYETWRISSALAVASTLIAAGFAMAAFWFVGGISDDVFGMLQKQRDEWVRMMAGIGVLILLALLYFVLV